MNPNDQYLLNQLKAGDVTAFTQLVDKYRRWMVYIAYTVLEDETEAHDIVQDFFMDCWEKQLFMNVSISLKSFLHCAMKNRCLNRLRDEALRRKKLKLLLQQATELPLQPAENSDFWERVLQVVEQVPPASAQVFRYTYFDGMNRKEVALQLGISPSTVKHQLARSLRIVRNLLLRSPQLNY
ncbi:MAG TPA: sigma-70 family RNA polymerase sigma factor [Chitinophaga sp.]|uniref:RNA polymerase sigma factor n=1 Tax=Chitinophaga sp. TaxID=1869181 RepID=UPI002F93FD4F